MVNEPTLIHFKEQFGCTPNKFFAKKFFNKIRDGGGKGRICGLYALAGLLIGWARKQ
jgi:hypothetical protein